MRRPLDKLTIEGFKSIPKLDGFPLSELNVLIGANGAGKSNFMSFFGLLHAIVNRQLQLEVARAGGAGRLLHLGRKQTRAIRARLEFGLNSFEFRLSPTADDAVVFAFEECGYSGGNPHAYGRGHSEARFLDQVDKKGTLGGPTIERYVHGSIAGWTIYHFHDTSETAAVRHRVSVRDNERFRPDGSNLAAFLLELRSTFPDRYEQIRDTVRLVAPFIDEFKLRSKENGGDEQVLLEWTQPGSDYPFHPSQLSDGTLRFICLATALLQPDPPSTMLFDEPELGLHPQALELLAALVKEAATQTQVIISTQSVALVNQFEPQDVVVVSRRGGASVFERLDAAALAGWLEDYAVGELWQKNVIAGGPVHE
ncbi:MAG: recombinase RecF [Phycisphaerales bacterium]|nr:MAG: recombinase RecF [Phycisphaerales bacterium]